MPGEHAFAPFIIVLGFLVVPLLLLRDHLQEAQPDVQQAVAAIAQAQEVHP
jgi:hypothetical protein